MRTSFGLYVPHYAEEAAWSPLDLTTLLAWYKADAGVISSGGAVSQWDDQSASGYDQLQGTANSQPHDNVVTQNSLPMINFVAGSPDDFMSATITYPAVNTASIFAVMRFSNAGDTNGRFVSIWDSASTNDYDNTGSITFLRNLTNAKVDAYYNSGSRGPNSTTLSYDTAYHLAMIRNGATVSFYLNGAADGSSGGGSTANLTATRLRIGNDNNTGSAATWALGELIVCSGDESASLSDINTYLDGRWAF